MKRKTKLLINVILIFALLQVFLLINQYSPIASINTMIISKKMDTDDIVTLNGNKDFLVYTDDTIVQIGHSKTLFYIRPLYRNILSKDTEIFVDEDHRNFYEINEGQGIKELEFDRETFEFSQVENDYRLETVNNRTYAINDALYNVGMALKIEEGKEYFTSINRFIEKNEKTVITKSLLIHDLQMEEYSLEHNSAVIEEFFEMSKIQSVSFMVTNFYEDLDQEGEYLFSTMAKIQDGSNYISNDYYLYRDQVVCIEGHRDNTTLERVETGIDTIYVVQPVVRDLLLDLLQTNHAKNF